MDSVTASDFVETWLGAWNGHDLDAVLAHFAEDVIFTSPVAARVVEGSDGVIRGNAALRRYWREGLTEYRIVSEVLKFDGPLVVGGHGTYLGDPSPGA
jgi:ketosteroid isomerase-like protein